MDYVFFIILCIRNIMFAQAHSFVGFGNDCCTSDDIPEGEIDYQQQQWTQWCAVIRGQRRFQWLKRTEAPRIHSVSMLLDSLLFIHDIT
jgi:hypothetical protein